MLDFGSSGMLIWVFQYKRDDYLNVVVLKLTVVEIFTLWKSISNIVTQDFVPLLF